jgi:hypothetical protein
MERQMGAFQTLVDIIDDMAHGIGHRYVSVADNTKATPGGDGQEQKGGPQN